MPGLLKRSVDYFWSALAAVLIAVAALVTIVRLLLPEIGAQRANIEAWITDTVGRPAVVGDIEASWRGWSPRIQVSEIAFLDESGTSELVHFDRAVINIDPLGSIARRTLQPQSLVLSGVELTVIRHEDGSLSVAGMPPPKSPIIKWLIKQDNFVVTEADLTIIDERGGSSFAVSNLTVGIRNRGERKFLNGHVTLPANVGRSLAFELSATGNPLEPRWDGMLNVRLDGIRSSYLGEKLNLKVPATPDTRVDLVTWTRWEQGRMKRAVFETEVAGAPDNGGPPAIGHGASARGLIQRHGDEWQLDLDHLDVPAIASPSSGARLTVRARLQDGGIRSAAIRAAALPIDPVAALAARLLPMPASVLEVTDSGRPSGMLARLDALWHVAADQQPRFYANAEIRRLALNRAGVAPGITGLDARVEMNALGGVVRFEHSDFKVDDDERLVATLDVSGLDGHVSWRSGPDGLRIASRRLAGTVDSTYIALSGAVEVPDGGSPHVDLALRFANETGTLLHHLLPVGALPGRGESWSRELFLAGNVPSGTVLLRGRLSEFPFDDGSGSFQVDYEVADANLQYARNWPHATNVSGMVRLRGREVAFDLEHGEVLGASIAGTNVSMPDMFTNERYVRISGTASGPASVATDIVMASPLRHTRAKRLQEVEVAGDVKVALDMNLALFPGGPREVLGQARLPGNRLVARGQKLALDKLRGSVTFTRSDWYGEGLTAEFNGNPVGLVLNGGLDDPNYDSEFRMTGNSDIGTLLETARPYAPNLHAWFETRGYGEALSGSIPWKAVLTIPTENTNGPKAPQRLALESSLVGLRSDLPWPFGKHAGEKKPLRVESLMHDGVALATQIDFGDTLDAEISRSVGADGTTRIDRAEILFGSIAPEFTKQPGISMRGYIPLIPLHDWAALLRSPDPQTAGGADALPVTFDVQVKELRILGRRVADVRLVGAKTPERWDVSLAGFDTNGRITIPHELEREAVVFDLDSLHLQGVEDDAAAESTRLEFEPTRMPEVRLRCASFRFEETDFGQAEVVTSRTDGGLRLEHLEFTNPDFTITADGSWLVREGVHSSRLNIGVNGAALTPLLDRFGYAVANIEGGATEIAIDAGWRGTPADFSLDRISGTFELHVTDGRFLDIEPGGGRLFGLLSLQTLPRRLSLDFNDLFQKGFAFDTIDGVFEIDAGNAYTNSLLMEGPSAKVDVSGRIGLAEKDYDQHVVVTPALSSSIPIASALFGPIGVGAGAVYYIGQKMFKSIPEQVNKFLSREYSIKGSWESPVIERI